uniref:Periplasmic heavy metal sensor n=1 Tax=Desulfobacca acetoxidans TaxID=60893 RepID=A0A7C3UYH9_9BACT
MKRNWLLYLLIFSLALNLGAIGTFAYLQGQKPPVGVAPAGPPPMPFGKLLNELHLDQQQLQTLRAMAPEHWRKVKELRQALARQRQELFDLIRRENLPDWPAVQAKIREIGNLQVQLEEEKVHHLMDVQKNLRPEQRHVLISQLEKRLPECRRGDRGGGPGMMRGKRGFGQGPPGPGPQGPPEMR